MRPFSQGILAVCLLCLATPQARADAALSRARHWVAGHLEAELKRPLDWNRISSLTFPLATDLRRHHSGEARRALTHLAGFLEGTDPDRLGCGDLVDAYLTKGFLDKAGVPVRLHLDEERIRSCDLGGSRLALANTLLFYCRYTDWDHRRLLPGGLARLERYQGENGAFYWDPDLPWFYFTSHAVLALHYCGGRQAIIDRGIGRMLSLIPEFKAQGKLDLLAEDLVFLRWLGREIPERAAHLAWLKGHQRPDGGLCYEAKPGCASHWHSSALLLQLLVME